MARDTEKTLRTQVCYQIFVRNFSEEGTFAAVEKQLDRIRALGVDIIWLMPVHPCGVLHRKGKLGSPYAVRDYRKVNPEFGTMEDFIHLTSEIHRRGMKVIIDIVYNHTSPDSWLAEHHPEWFYHKEDGSFGNKIGDWWDVADLDYENRDLWRYQIDTLKYWAEWVDGFRCDVAPMVPLEFWKQARTEVETVRPGCIWLAESVEPEMIRENRRRGIFCASDAELYQAFDITYEYDVYSYLKGYLTGELPLSDYTAALNRQEGMYPDNYVKLRFLENHDRARAHFLIPGEKALVNFTAFLYFQKGLTLLYAGQEREAVHAPGLFDRDPVDWSAGRDLSPLLKKLSEIRRDPIFADSTYEVSALPRDTVLALHTRNTWLPEQSAEGTVQETARAGKYVGIFSLRGEPSLINVGRVLPDGFYENRITGDMTEVKEGQLSCTGDPVIIRV